MTAVTLDACEYVPALARLARLLERRRRRQQPDKRVRELQPARIQLGIGRGVRAGGQRLARHRPLLRHRWIGDADLDLKRAVVELAEGWYERLAPKPPQAPVDEAIGTARNAIVIAIVPVGVGENDRVWDGVEQPEPQDIRSRPGGDGGNSRRQRFAVDAERRVERGSHAVLEDGAPLVGKLVTDEPYALGMKHRNVPLDLVAHAAGHRILVALPASAAVEQRAQSDCGRKSALEHHAATVESRTLRGGQAAQWIAWLEPFARRGRSQRSRDEDHAARHGVEPAPASMLPMRSIA